jgi:hypothetical protein
MVLGLVKPPHWVLWHADVVHGKGLFPCARPCSFVYCSLYFSPGHWVIQPLSLAELLQLYQLPHLTDLVLKGVEPDKGLPFADSPAPNLFASIFWQLWSEVGGGSGYDTDLEGVKDEAPTCRREGGIDGGLLEGMVDSGLVHNVVDVGLVVEPGRTPLLLQDMTAHTEPDLWSCDAGLKSRRPWHFDFGDIVGRANDGGGLTDEETVTFAALEETLQGTGGCWPRSHGGLVRDHKVGSMLEPHEIGACVYNPDPPFLVGDVIMCSVGNHGLQQAFVSMLDHRRYRLTLERGDVAETSIKEGWMSPRLD